MELNNLVFLGIDNGNSGTFSFYKNGDIQLFKTPIIKNSIQKGKSSYSRINHERLYNTIKMYRVEFAFIENPYINPKSSFTTEFAVRADESFRIVLERLNIKYSHISAAYWQNDLPVKIKGGTKKSAVKSLKNYLDRGIIKSIRGELNSIPSQFPKDVDSVFLAYHSFVWYKNNINKIKLTKYP